MTATRETRAALALVALPWAKCDMPSAALGALSAYVRRERPGLAVATYHACVDFAAGVGLGAYHAIAERAYSVGEPLYLPLLYPERTPRARAQFISAAERELAEHLDPNAFGARIDTWGGVFDLLMARMDAHLDELATELAGKYRVVGLTTSFGQLFANLVLAKRLKALDPDVAIVLGGSSVSDRVGASLLNEYRWVDYIVQGEGERPLLGLVDRLIEGAPADGIAGVLGRPGPKRLALLSAPASVSQMPNLDDLPYPDFDEYADRAERHGIAWTLSLEGSRGCWWDRTARTGDPRATCYFCNLNVQWAGYREKSAARLVEEVQSLCARYRVLDLFFVDNIMRASGVEALAGALSGLGLDIRYFYELRAHIAPRDLVRLWQSGLRGVQFGIEGLSTSFLKRVGKGTTAIQNLQAMKLCEELGLVNEANLITDLPGSLAAEVDETAEAIARFALPYRPCFISPFQLGTGSTMATLADEFGVTGARNADALRPGMPDDVWRRLRLLNLDFDRKAVSWDKVKRARERWRRKYEATPGGALLQYRDGRSFLIITDRRGDRPETVRYEGLDREIYLFCCQIRTEAQIRQRFGLEGSPEALHRRLAHPLEADLMFHENGRYLSLATACSPDVAARRILDDDTRPVERRAPAVVAEARRRAAPQGEAAGSGT